MRGWRPQASPAKTINILRDTWLSQEKSTISHPIDTDPQHQFEGFWEPIPWVGIVRRLPLRRSHLSSDDSGLGMSPTKKQSRGNLSEETISPTVRNGSLLTKSSSSRDMKRNNFGGLQQFYLLVVESPFSDQNIALSSSFLLIEILWESVDHSRKIEWSHPSRSWIFGRRKIPLARLFFRVNVRAPFSYKVASSRKFRKMKFRSSPLNSVETQKGWMRTTTENSALRRMTPFNPAFFRL